MIAALLDFLGCHPIVTLSAGIVVGLLTWLVVEAGQVELDESRPPEEPDLSGELGGPVFLSSGPSLWDGPADAVPYFRPPALYWPGTEDEDEDEDLAPTG